MESERRKLRPVASEKIYKPGEHLSGDQFEWVHPTEDIRVLGTILVDVGSRTAVVKIQRQGTFIENLGNITGHGRRDPENPVDKILWSTGDVSY